MSCTIQGFVVAVPAVNVVVLLPSDNAKFADGLLSADHTVLELPEHEPKLGGPPLVSVRQRVPAPPVAVENRAPEELV